MANLLEAYSKRIAISESVYSKQHSGAKMDNHKKLVVAKCLENVNKFMNEAFDTTVGTQRSDMGLFKKFCLNLTTVALPNLIAHDLVLVSPMSSMSGYITYIEYAYSVDKGDVKAGTEGAVINSPFKLGGVDSSYTSDKVVETIATASTTFTAAWAPVYFNDKANANEARLNPVVIITRANGKVDKIDATNVVNNDNNTATITFPTYTLDEGDTAKVAYVYNNLIVPQDKIPAIKAEMKSMPLLAKARRIAVYYSQIAAFQAKTDYGFDLGDQLAEKAVGQLSYEIDTEIVELLADTAKESTNDDEYKLLTWNKARPNGVSKSEHYEGFSEIVEIARQIIYDRTKRFAPNYMIIASDILPVLTFIKGFSAAATGSVNGPYFAGTLNGLKVFVSPVMTAGKFVIGVNGDDMMSSVAVYAPYMAVVPTQLLQYADGGTSQGWSTMYDLKVLNKNLIVAGEVKFDNTSNDDSQAIQVAQ